MVVPLGGLQGVPLGGLVVMPLGDCPNLGVDRAAWWADRRIRSSDEDSI